ncbi:MAG: FecR domain-containing protein, partial [Clostridia bacterium]|nr:FecR domain-containing protein [Clostridia bacterium]
MKKRNLLSLLTVLVALLLLCAGASAESAEADTIRFLKAEGEVTVYNPAGQPRFAVANARFGSGEAIETGADGYAAISLDDTKIVSLDKETRLEFVREGSHMKLTVVRGTIFVDVSEKLDENESLDIETTTLMVGIRGTMIAAGVLPEGTQQVMLLEGKTEITYQDPDGTQRQMMLSAGEMLASGGPNAVSVPTVSPLTRDAVSVFVRREIDRAPERAERAREAGTYSMIEEKPADDEDKDPQEEERGDGWVYPGEVVLTAASATKYYDGEPLSRTDDVLVSGLPPEFSILVTSIGSQTEPGTGLNSIAGYAIVDQEGREVNDRFHVRTVNGQLTVNPLPLTIWTGSAEKEYDGTPLTCGDVRVTAAQGYVAEQPDWTNCAVSSVSDIGAHTLCAASGNIQVYLTDPFTGDPVHLELPAGKRLTVSVREENGKKTFCYDIAEMSEQDIPEDILRLYARNPEMMALACEAAGWDMDLVREMISALPAGDDPNVEAAGMDMPEGVASKLIVDSVDVRVIADSDGKDYNGRALGTEEAKYYPIRLPEITVTATGTITLPGSCDNTYEILWGKGADPDHYVIYEELGTLTVTESAAGTVFLRAGSAERPYDGTPLKSNEVEVRGLPEEYTWKAGTEGSQTDAGTGVNTVSWYSIYSPAGEDVTEQFGGMVRLVNGTLTVTPAAMRISTGSSSREYDGTPLTNGDVTVLGLVGGENIAVTATGTITDVGTAENTCTIDWGDTHPDNYAVTVALGTLEVTKNTGTITFTVDPITKAYDGLPLRVSTAAGDQESTADPRPNNGSGGLTIHADGLPEGLSFEAWAFCNEVHPGTYFYSITVVVRDPSGRDVTEYFTGLAVPEGELTIEPARITVTTGSAEKIYDGTPLTCAEAALTGLVNGETAFVAATGSLTAVGTTDNTYVITWGTADPVNYTVVETLGTLTVKANDTALVITAASAEKAYDGTALTADGFTVENLPAGFTLTATVSGSRTDAGTGENTVTDYTILDAENNDVTASFTGVTTVKGELKVTPALLTVKTDPATKTYDGTALTC